MSQAGIANLSNSASGFVNLVAGPGISISGGSPLNLGGTATISLAAPNPLQTISDFDDFLAYTGNSSSNPKLGFAGNGFAGGFYNQKFGTSTNPGQISNLLGGFNIGLTTQNTNSQSANSANFRLGGGSLSINWIVALQTLSTGVNRYNFYIGLSDFDAAGALTKPNNGCWFQYSDNVNSGNWQMVCGSGGVYTTTNTSIAATTGFVNFGVSVNAAGTSVSFTINGASAGTAITTNIPTATSISPFILAEQTVGSLPEHSIDLFYYTQVLSVARPG